jgi:ribose 5-phosphate isomerase A
MQGGPGKNTASDTDAAKRAAAAAAVAMVQAGMVVGLGSGSTMRFAIDALGRRVREEGLRIVGIPTSRQIGAQASALGLALAEPSGTPIDLALDGADEIEAGTLRLIKGLGGALLREKIVAQNSRRFVVVADSSKVTDGLGTRSPLPVEVERFGHAATARRIADLGATCTLRTADDHPFTSDGGNWIYDCAGFGPILDPFTLDRRLRAIAGVVETGLFLDCAEQALVAVPDGTVQTLRPQ